MPSFSFIDDLEEMVDADTYDNAEAFYLSSYNNERHKVLCNHDDTEDVARTDYCALNDITNEVLTIQVVAERLDINGTSGNAWVKALLAKFVQELLDAADKAKDVCDDTIQELEQANSRLELLEEDEGCGEKLREVESELDSLDDLTQSLNELADKVARTTRDIYQSI